MKTNPKELLLGLLVAALFPIGCSPVEPSSEDLQVVVPGKEDNYYSNVASEFECIGKVLVTMTEEEYADVTIGAEKINGRLTAVALYLTGYLTDKLDEFFTNLEYGGFHAMVRNHSIEAKDVQPDGLGNYWVHFTLDAAGPQDVLSVLPGTWNAETKTLDFSIQMPAGESISPDNVPWREVLRGFDPSKYEGELESVSLQAKALDQIGNAWPQYAGFMSDGLFDITLFYGHDYNEARSDLRGAKEAFSNLVSKGYTPPVQSFDLLTKDSGPFVKNIKAAGQPVRVEVRIFHSNLFENARKEQHDLALSEAASRDVFFYNGHAGPYYGFYLDASGEAKVDYREFATLSAFTEKQQLFIAQGCQTYSQYADMLYKNPMKSEENLDVITTVNFSYGQGIMDMLNSLIKTDANGSHVPVDFYSIIQVVNQNWINSSYNVFYGVMGIDGNPQLHPYGNSSVIGTACNAAGDCGDVNAHVCLKPSGSSKQCGIRTLGAKACPEGTRYLQIANGGAIIGGACFAL